MMLVISLFLFVLFLACQNDRVKKWLKERSLEQIDIIILLLVFISGLIDTKSYSIVLEDKLYSLPWELTLDNARYLLIVGFFSYSMKFLSFPRTREKKDQIKFGVTYFLLLLAFIFHTPLIWAFVIVVCCASLEIEKNQKKCIQIFPLSIVLIEALSVSLGYGLTQQVINKYDTIYSSGIVTAFLPFAFLLSLISLLSVGKKNEGIALSLLPGMMLLYGLVSVHFNNEVIFKNLGFITVLIWTVLTIQKTLSSSALFRLNQAVLSWGLLLYLILAQYQLIKESYLALGIIFLVFTSFKARPHQVNEKSILVMAERSILMILLISIVAIKSLGLTLGSDTSTLIFPHVDSILMMGIFWIIVLRLNLEHFYNMKSESFLDFADSKFVAQSFIKILLLLILTYLILGKIDLSNKLLLLGAFVPVVFFIANIMGHLQIFRVNEDKFFMMTPANYILLTNSFSKEVSSMILGVAVLFELLFHMFCKALIAINNYLSHVSFSVVQAISNNKIPSLFMIWIIMISIVASWSL